jgi:hypothetical protein
MPKKSPKNNRPKLKKSSGLSKKSPKPKIPADQRDPLWADIEADVQSRASQKDPQFRLAGPWKKFLRRQDGFKVYAVDGDWVRNNLSIIFGHGGHGYVHEFIPLDEIWIATHHYPDCGCGGVGADQKFSPEYFDSTTLHEITECQEMKKGRSYWQAHNLSIAAEQRAGFLPDPFDDIY